MQGQYAVPLEVQEFLSGIPSRALTNVLWDIDFSNTDNLIPSNPGATRRSLLYDKGGMSPDATPNPIEFNCWIKDLNNTTDLQITESRGI